MLDPGKVEEDLGVASLLVAGTECGLTAVRFGAYSGSVPVDALSRALQLAVPEIERRLKAMGGPSRRPGTSGHRRRSPSSGAWM